MPKRIHVELSPSQQIELEQVRDRHPKAYLRERAAAVLKVAGGQNLTQVGQTGLLKRHEPETIHAWIRGYLEAGIASWKVKAGRGRKPKFSPSE